MNCLSLSVSRRDTPMSVSVERIVNPLDISLSRIMGRLTITVGLVCSVDDSPAGLISSDKKRLVSKDGFVLFSKRVA